MIGSFWNLCRACPSMPVDKLHSEYRSTYRWHEYTGPRHEVVRRPPQGTQAGEAATAATVPVTSNAGNVEETVDATAVHSKCEPAISRKKKHPQLAYRTHEFLPMTDSGASEEPTDSAVKADRARSEERAAARNQPSRRSKSEGPPEASAATVQSGNPLQIVKAMSPPARSESEPSEEDMINPIASVISRISTEYQLQFAWPRGDQGKTKTDNYQDSTPPRKSVSMGAIRPTGNPNLVPVHKKRVADADQGEDGVSELEPLVAQHAEDGHASFEFDDSQGEEKIQEEMSSKEEKPRRRKEFKTEYKKRYRPFSHYEYVEGKFQKKKGTTESCSLPLALPEMSRCNSWFREVIELRKKAGEYKIGMEEACMNHLELLLKYDSKAAGLRMAPNLTYKHVQPNNFQKMSATLMKQQRGWGNELVPQHIAELYNKQIALWEQVSRRSSLSALSLATTAPRSISKEEKDKENSKKTSPTTPASTCQSTARHPAVVNMTHDVDKKVAHVPVPVGLPMDKSEDMKSDVFRSRKDFLIRHHLQRTTGAEDGALLTSPTREKLEPVMPRPKEDEATRSPKRASPKSSPSSKNRSPKRQSRLSSSASSAATQHPSMAQQNGGVHVERRPRPTVWSSSGNPGVSRVRQPTHSITTTPFLATNAPPCPKSSSDHAPLSQHSYTKPISSRVKLANGVREDLTKLSSRNKQDATEDSVETDLQESVTKRDEEREEPLVVKSPAEPTRVKSPEQIIMRSPEPVNWTVPLDTGKTFTVTQNIHDAMPYSKYRGEMITRPHSEVKAWTPPASRPPAAQSAPPELSRQQHHELHGNTESGASSPTDATDIGFQSHSHGDRIRPEGSSIPFTGSQEDDPTHEEQVSKEPIIAECESFVEGTTLRCLDAPDNPSLLYEVDKLLPKCSESAGPGSQALYHVLEAPSQPDPVCSETALSRTMPIVSPSTSRSLASDVLEKARNRFDKFWGKGKDSGDKQGKV
ncbi:uncharacterized protein LOC134529251 isoform X1 [Bacillus rossius redtenbacheri]|uniref:uncharacterized protein LOC134529251 isoform X1 n=1 Tax=Bacillus rossius redtenbacheri TaxID=93214 RepID=UPI002FDEBE30